MKMNPMSSGCGGMNTRASNLKLSLCAALELLMQEHIPLWEALHEFHATADRVITEAGSDNNDDTFNLLYDQVISFEANLKVHARKEDDGLFPMMARYLGREAGPISVMEYEHEQADIYL
jgi:regulator of cell morphogenesis and NO signaling